MEHAETKGLERAARFDPSTDETALGVGAA